MNDRCEERQMTQSKKRLQMAFMVNVLVAAMEIVAVVKGLLTEWKTLQEVFNFYTHDSNFLALAACTVMAVDQSMRLLGEKKEPSRLAMRLKAMATGALTLTFLVVLFVLWPMNGLESGNFWFLDSLNIYHHTLCPLLCICSFIFLEDYTSFGKREALDTMLITLLYGIIMVVLILTGTVTEAPYPFLQVNEQSVGMSILWFVVLMGGSYLISLGLIALNHRAQQGKQSVSAKEK